MPQRKGSAEWKGGLKDGRGSVATGSGALEGSFSFGSRFEEGKGTNPEELIGAAHAACFSMALSAALGKAGYEPLSETSGLLTIEYDAAPPPSFCTSGVAYFRHAVEMCGARSARITHTRCSGRGDTVRSFPPPPRFAMASSRGRYCPIPC